MILRPRFERLIAFLRARFSSEGLFGLHLTIGSLAVWRRRGGSDHEGSAYVCGCDHIGMVSHKRHAFVHGEDEARFRVCVDCRGVEPVHRGFRFLVMEAPVVRITCIGAGCTGRAAAESAPENGVCPGASGLGRCRSDRIQLSERPHHDRGLVLRLARRLLRFRGEVLVVARNRSCNCLHDNLRSGL